MAFLTDDRKTLTLRLNENNRKLFNRLAEELALDPADDTIKDLLESILDLASKKLQPNIDLKNKIEAQQKEIEDLKTQLSEKIKETQTQAEQIEYLKNQFTEESKDAENSAKLLTDKETVITELKTQLHEANIYNAELKSKLTKANFLADDEIIVKINPFLDEIIEKYLQNKNIIASFKKANQNGRMNGIYDVIDTDNLKTNVANMLTTTFIASVQGKVLIPVLTKNQLNTAINSYLKSAQ